MFCNKCGRTIKGDETVCQKCGAQIGESRFEGSGYTSVQSRHIPSEPEAVDSPYTPYTRTTYTTMDQPEEEDVLTRTTYRPILSGDKKEEEREPPKSEETAANEAPAGAEKSPRKIEIEPLKPIVMKGISPDVEDYIKRISHGSSSLSTRRKRPHIEDEDQAEETAKIDLSVDDEDDFAPSIQFGKIGRILGLAAGSLVILGLLVFGFFRLSSNVAPKSPIEGVSKSVYEDGLALIKEHVKSEYRTELLKMFPDYSASTNENTEDAFAKMDADEQQIKALLPENQQENDQKFIDALLAIQKSINDAITFDYTVLVSRNNDSSDLLKKTSDDAWKTVLSAIDRISSATDPLELNQIAQSAKVDTTIDEALVTTASPTPSPYKSLSKGAKNDDVKKLQQRLIELNYMTGQADGDFGSGTQTAVKLFQKTIGMQEQNGIASPTLQEALFADDAPVYNSTQSTQPAQQGQ